MTDPCLECMTKDLDFFSLCYKTYFFFFILIYVGGWSFCWGYSYLLRIFIWLCELAFMDSSFSFKITELAWSRASLSLPTFIILEPFLLLYFYECLCDLWLFAYAYSLFDSRTECFSDRLLLFWALCWLWDYYISSSDD